MRPQLRAWATNVASTGISRCAVSGPADLSADHPPVVHHQIGDAEAADPRDVRALRHLGAQAFRDRGAGVQEIDIDAARHAVAGRRDLLQMPALARPFSPYLVGTFTDKDLYVLFGR